MTLQNIENSIYIEAPIQRVWTVLTAQGLVEQWLGCIGYSGEVGSTFYMQPDAAKRAVGDIGGATHCELAELEPPRKMLFTWFMPGAPKTEVEISLRETEGGTLAMLVHRGWDQFDEADVKHIHRMLGNGWQSFVMPGLKRAAEAAG